MSTEPATTTPLAGRSLVSLLGEQRAAIVERLRRDHDASVAELARELDISEVATRRHLAVLEEDGLVAAQTVNQGRGRPAARYSLTADARRLFPQGHDQLAGELLGFLAEHADGDGLREFLRWRLSRQVEGLRDAVTAEDLHERLQQLAGRLSEAGYAATVSPDGEGFTLRQHHCAIQDAAEQHPELCAYEAAGFAKVLGTDVRISRRETLAEGGSACVCCVQPRTATTANEPTMNDPRPRSRARGTQPSGTSGRGDQL
ncbi:helix-turn-helix transcriptional regulator [Egicoccus sp. AB-alg6-2]|uniref:helix-turn-helix transcriptional regulator n=1 Tax=Egicoccus sp. AB-alg6-2 TaxID=3242692 RepID=UPI00359CFE75